MKRIEKFFVTLLLSTVVFSVKSQNEENALRNVVERNTYGDNWFISANVNANLLTAEQDGYMSLMDRIKLGGAFSFGKWFNPNFGARIQVMGGGLKGFNDVKYYGSGPNDISSIWYVHTNYDHRWYPIGGIPDPSDPGYDPDSKYKYYTPKNGPIGFLQEFNYANATLDLLANFSNLMRGHYRERSPVDVIGFVGLGVMHAFNNNVTTPSHTHFAAKVGFRFNFNITDNIAIYLEPQATATDKEFDGYAGTALGDGVVNLGLGIQYTFNKQFTTLSQIIQLTADEIDRLNRKINDNRYLIENHQDILERQQNLLDRLEKCCDDNKKEIVYQTIETQVDLPEYVRFSLNSSKVEPIEQRKISEVANYLQKNPNSKLLIIGYADRKTGNPRYNLNLSRKRVDNVANELKRAGVAGNRIITEWKGDKEQPFPQNEWNRVVVMVERK